MPMQTWVESIASNSTDGTALTASTAETSIAPPNTHIVLGSNYFDKIGAAFRILATGRISTVVTTPGTLTFRIKLGPTANIAVATSQALALNVVAKVNVTWWLDWLLILRTNGAGTSASFMNVGQWSSEAVVGSPLPSAGGSGGLLIPASAPVVGTGFDGTTANTFDLTAQWSISNANSIQVHELIVQSLN